MTIEDSIRVDRWKAFRKAQEEKRILVIELPEWIARVLRFFNVPTT